MQVRTKRTLDRAVRAGNSLTYFVGGVLTAIILPRYSVPQDLAGVAVAGVIPTFVASTLFLARQSGLADRKQNARRSSARIQNLEAQVASLQRDREDEIPPAARIRRCDWDGFELPGADVSQSQSRSPIPGVARVHRSKTSPDLVLVVPQQPDGDRQGIESFSVSRKVIRDVRRWLKDFDAAPSNAIAIGAPSYLALTVAVQVKANKGVNHAKLEARVRSALDAYFDARTGGPDQCGWPFGKSVTHADVQAAVHGVEGLNTILRIRLFPADPALGIRGPHAQEIALGPDELIMPWGTTVSVV